MFSVTVKRVRLGIGFSFPAVLALVLLTGGADTAQLLIMLMCSALHECGHLAAMFIFRRRPEAVTLYGGGIRITPPRGRMDSFGRDITVLLAGCAVNFLLAGAAYLYKGMGDFVYTNLFLGVFNLLPFGYFDGGRVLEMLCAGRAAKTARLVFFLLGAAYIALTALSGNVSLSFLVTFCFIAAEEVISEKE